MQVQQQQHFIFKIKKKKTFRFSVSAGITRPQGDGVSSL
jgi:hypothetical protein